MATTASTAVDDVEPDAPAKRHIGAWVEMLIGSSLGMVAAMVLSIDAVKLAADPTADLSCNISAKISCGTVGTSWQASLLGFPNAFLGLIFEAVVIAFAVAGLAGVRFPRWYMLGVQAMYTIAIAFAYWLFLQAYFVIGAMCPWCLLVTVTTLFVFASLTRINILEGNFGVGVKRRLEPALRHYADVFGCILITAVIAAMVIVRYL